MSNNIVHTDNVSTRKARLGRRGRLAAGVGALLLTAGVGSTMAVNALSLPAPTLPAPTLPTANGLMKTSSNLPEPFAGSSSFVQSMIPGAKPAPKPAQEPVTVKVEGLFKPNSELDFSVSCPDTSTSAKLTTTFGAQTDLHPAADTGYLIGTITAPNNITPGPDQGYHNYTVTCASGKQVTQRFSEDGNFRTP